MVAINIKLRPDVKERWVSALRSGQYKQADGVLGTKIPDGREWEGLCCLGVQAVVEGVPTEAKDGPVQMFNFDGVKTDNYPTDRWFAKYLLAESPLRFSDVSINFSSSINEVMFENKPLGLNSMNVLLLQFAGMIKRHLAVMNDRKEPFSKIADWIDENL